MNLLTRPMPIRCVAFRNVLINIVVERWISFLSVWHVKNEAGSNAFIINKTWAFKRRTCCTLKLHGNRTVSVLASHNTKLDRL